MKMKATSLILSVLFAAVAGCSGKAVRDVVAEHPITIRLLHSHNDQLQGQAGAQGFDGMVAYDVFTNVTAAGESLFWVKKRREFEANDIASVSIQTADAGRTLLSVTLTRAGAHKLGHGGFDPSPSAPIGLAVFEGQRLMAVGTLTQYPASLDLPLQVVYVDNPDQQHTQLILRNRAEHSPGE